MMATVPDLDDTSEITELQAANDRLDAAHRAITDLQARWAETYCGPARFNAARASRLCGVNERSGQSWRQHGRVREYIDALLSLEARRLLISRGAILQELAYVAFNDATDAFDDVTAALAEKAQEADADPEAPEDPETGLADPGANQEPRGIPQRLLVLKSVRDLPRSIARAISSMEFENGRLTKIRFYDKLKALELLGRAHAMFDRDSGAPDEGLQKPWTGFQIVAPAQKGTEDDRQDA